MFKNIYFIFFKYKHVTQVVTLIFQGLLKNKNVAFLIKISDFFLNTDPPFDWPPPYAMNK